MFVSSRGIAAFTRAVISMLADASSASLELPPLSPEVLKKLPIKTNVKNDSTSEKFTRIVSMLIAPLFGSVPVLGRLQAACTFQFTNFFSYICLKECKLFDSKKILKNDEVRENVNITLWRLLSNTCLSSVSEFGNWRRHSRQERLGRSMYFSWSNTASTIVSLCWCTATFVAKGSSLCW